MKLVDFLLIFDFDHFDWIYCFEIEYFDQVMEFK